MKIEYSPGALNAAAGYLRDDASGVRAAMDAIDALAEDPRPEAAFIRGEYMRLAVGHYRIFYSIHGDVVSIDRFDRL